MKKCEATKTKAERPCNGIEQVFVACNIRFAVAVWFVAPIDVGAAQEAVSAAVRESICGWLVIVQSGEACSLCCCNSDELPKTCTREADNPEEALQTEVSADNPANGAIHLVLFKKDGLCTGFCINACHAACDGRSMRNLIEKCLQKASLNTAANVAPPAFVQVDWGSLLQQHRLTKCDASPLFLPLPATAVCLAELCMDDKNDGCNMRLDVLPSVVSNAITASREHQASITGLWVACLAQAAAEIYFKRHSKQQCCISVSVLVDMRPHLPPGTLVAQAFGTVTVGVLVCQENDESSLSSLILRHASAATADIRARISRGEAHRSAIALCEGKFDEGPPAATIELSNHGVYQIPEGTCEKLLLAQRFDGYDGISVSIHSESASGVMRLCASGPARFGDALLSRAAAHFAAAAHVVLPPTVS
jgi:hypothetical protein